MTEFGHEWARGPNICMDSWGAGPFVLVTKGKRYVFEDSDRFGPAIVDLQGDPTNVMIPAKSPFWKAWKRWVEEGRKTTEGKPLGRGPRKLKVLYCLYSDLRKDAKV